MDGEKNEVVVGRWPPMLVRKDTNGARTFDTCTARSVISMYTNESPRLLHSVHALLLRFRYEKSATIIICIPVKATDLHK